MDGHRRRTRCGRRPTLMGLAVAGAPVGHPIHIDGLDVTDEPRARAKTGVLRDTEWARLDSNQGPTDYESAALTS